MSAPAVPPTTRRGNPAVGTALMRLALVLVILFFGGPLLWVVAAAFDAEAGSYVPWPHRPTLTNFADLFGEFGFGRVLRTSLVVCGTSAALTAFSAALAGYALSRLRWRGASAIASGMLLLQTMPLAATMVPLFDLTRRLELRNSYFGLIVVHAVLVLPFLVWLMKGFFDAVPVVLEEAAWLDGASRLRAWRDVLLPMARPGLLVAFGLAFAAAWAEVILMLVLVDEGEGKETVALAFYRLYRSAGGFSDIGYELVAAMGLLYVLPVVLLFAALGRFAVPALSGSTHGE